MHIAQWTAFICWCVIYKYIFASISTMMNERFTVYINSRLNGIFAERNVYHSSNFMIKTVWPDDIVGLLLWKKNIILDTRLKYFVFFRKFHFMFSCSHIKCSQNWKYRQANTRTKNTKLMITQHCVHNDTIKCLTQ